MTLVCALGAMRLPITGTNRCPSCTQRAIARIDLTDDMCACGHRHLCSHTFALGSNHDCTRVQPSARSVPVVSQFTLALLTSTLEELGLKQLHNNLLLILRPWGKVQARCVTVLGCHKATGPLKLDAFAQWQLCKHLLGASGGRYFQNWFKMFNVCLRSQ